MSRFSRLAPSLALLPFLLYLTVFLLVPTITVVVGAFTEGGRFTLSNITALVDPVHASGAVDQRRAVGGQRRDRGGFGAVLAYLVVTGGRRSWLRRSVTSLSGVLAQCGGVMLAFAFIATIGFSGALTIWLRDHFGIDIFGSGWLFALPGLILVYSYFQIPLMVIVFLPALDGIKPQWREASVNLGANSWQYWTQVGVPAAAAGLPGRHPAAVRQRVRRLRDGRRAGQPGQPDRAAADPVRAQQRGPARAPAPRVRAGLRDDRRRRDRDGGLRPPAAADREVAPVRPSGTFRVVRMVLLLVFAVFFFGPLLSMLDFSTRGADGTRTWDAWANLVKDPELNHAIVSRCCWRCSRSC